jgi:hypothetical protein
MADCCGESLNCRGKIPQIMGLKENIKKWQDHLEEVRERIARMQVYADNLRRSGGERLCRRRLVLDCRSQVAVMMQHVLLGEEVVMSMIRMRFMTGPEIMEFMKSDECMLVAEWCDSVEKSEKSTPVVLAGIKGDGSRQYPYLV